MKQSHVNKHEQGSICEICQPAVEHGADMVLGVGVQSPYFFLNFLLLNDAFCMHSEAFIIDISQGM